LKGKGINITEEEEQAAKIAILLHDIGHGPYSHALENILIKNVSHEKLSIAIIQYLNSVFEGKLSLALEIFTDKYHKSFLFQLVSGQLDVDRMDYLSRDSFFTGVSEGVIGYDRIIKMLTVKDAQLMVESKGIYSIEKFLVARRLMYWQVYLHKTVVSAEKMLTNIIERARELIDKGEQIISISPALDVFIHADKSIVLRPDYLELFCGMDDYDVMSTIKKWTNEKDVVLSSLCRMLVERKLLKVEFSATEPDPHIIEKLKTKVSRDLGISVDEARYLVFSGQAVNTTYNFTDERINILFRDGTVKDISQVDNALIHQTLASPVKKFYICFMA
jgi:HD superfamily phosphohydrolase